jgi:hypothetical protein
MLFGPQKLHLNFLRELAPVGKWLISKKNKEKRTGSTDLLYEPCL